MGQLGNALNSRPQGSLPSDTENPRRDGKEHCKAISLRSGKELKGPVLMPEQPREPTSIQEEGEKEDSVEKVTRQVAEK